MPSINDAKHEEAVDASWEASRGAVAGAVKWGIGSALLGAIGYAVSPVYRGLTIQFKVYALLSFFLFPLSILRLSRACLGVSIAYRD